MGQKGLDRLQAVQKLEKRLGQSLAMTVDVIESRVDAAVSKQVVGYGLAVRALDVARVEWEQLIGDAGNRRPPFDPGQKEKGFRDAVLAETFFQVVEESPTTPRACRVVLVTGDNLLAGAVESRMAGRSNVRVLRSLEELRGWINVLVAAV